MPYNEPVNDDELFTDDVEEHDNEKETCTGNYKNAAALWILKTRELYRLPNSSMESIVQDVSELFSALQSIYLNDVVSVLKQNNVDSQVLSQLPSIPKPFAGLETQYLQNQFFRTNFSYVASLL